MNLEEPIKPVTADSGETITTRFIDERSAHIKKLEEVINLHKKVNGFFNIFFVSNSRAMISF
jgi:hypothetical protein